MSYDVRPPFTSCPPLPSTNSLRLARACIFSLALALAHAFCLSLSITHSSHFTSFMCLCCEHMSWAGLSWEFLVGQYLRTLLRLSPPSGPPRQEPFPQCSANPCSGPPFWTMFWTSMFWTPLASAGLRPAAGHCAACDRHLVLTAAAAVVSMHGFFCKRFHGGVLG